MSDEELRRALADRMGKRVGLAKTAELIARCRDVLDCIASGIKGEYNPKDTSLNPDYHLETTLTVADAREVAALIDELDTLFRKAVMTGA